MPTAVQPTTSENEATGLLAQTFRAFRHANYRLYFFGLLISWIGTWMHRTALGWLVYEKSGSEMLLGLFSLAISAPIVLASPWGGSIIDQLPRRPILILTNMWLMGLALGLAALTALDLLQSWHMFLIGTLEGLAMAVDTPARQALLFEIVARSDLANAVALNSTLVNIGRVVGPALAGILMASFGPAWCFALNGLSFLAVISAVALMELQAPTHNSQAQAILSSVRAGFRYVKGSTALRNALLLFGAFGLLGSSFSVLLPAYARDLLHVSAKQYGILISLNACGAIVGALAVAHASARIPLETLRAFGSGIFTVGLAILTMTRNSTLCGLTLLAAGVGQMLFVSSTSAMIQLHAADEFRGRVMGIWAALFSGVMPVGGLLAGMIATVSSLMVVLIIGTAVCLLVTLLAFRQAKGNGS